MFSAFKKSVFGFNFNFKFKLGVKAAELKQWPGSQANGGSSISVSLVFKQISGTHSAKFRAWSRKHDWALAMGIGLSQARWWQLN
mmetsp:Transcript_71172/g.143271  ORF Transcript_71172/g.143271 Transcript_71172/m.143271 type:complete len:85 (-) Transcript_71172:70-324(-)